MKNKMLNGELYDPNDEELVALRKKCHNLCREYNSLSEDNPKRNEILEEIGIKLGKNVFLQGPIYFDYGCFVSIGENSYANFNFTVLDTCPVRIGNDVFIGTGVSLVTPLHPMHYEGRNIYFDNEKGRYTNDEYGAPITIGDNCWICSNVTIVGGVTIGSGCVIGAGSVVTRDIPDNSFAAGNPCRVIRQINEQDRENYKKMKQ
ncbi:MAG: sugar O-acetyltransferase [Bacilli bacterium]|nr:sugar O-acetyltransferase [Bacilli bacterium]